MKPLRLAADLWRTHPGRVPFAALVVFVVVFAIINPGLFNPFQMATSVNVMGPLVLAALAQFLIITTGGIDLSIAGLISLTNVLFVQLAMLYGPLPAVVMTLAAGTLCGFINGALVSWIRLPPVVVTLATSFIFTATAVMIQDRPGGSVPFEFMDVVTGLWFGILPAGAIWIAVGTIGVALLLHRTVLGRIIFGAGRGDLGLISAGQSPAFGKIAAYTIAGFVATAAAILLATGAASGDPRAGTPYLLTSIAAVAIGGGIFSGRKASVLGVFSGATILALLDSLLFFAGVSGSWKYLIGGLIIVLTVLIPFLGTLLSKRRTTEGAPA
jgi:ribose transport system permease protein